MCSTNYSQALVLMLEASDNAMILLLLLLTASLLKTWAS